MTEEKLLRTCSRCGSTKLEEYFSKNVKGLFYKLCDNCRSKRRTYYKEWNAENKDKLNEYRKRNYLKVRSEPLENQYLICEKCGQRVHRLNEGIARHQRRLTCINKTTNDNNKQQQQQN